MLDLTHIQATQRVFLVEVDLLRCILLENLDIYNGKWNIYELQCEDKLFHLSRPTCVVWNNWANKLEETKYSTLSL